MRFKGIYTALITPFDGERVDEAAFRRFVSWQVGEGVQGVVPCGTTGESPTLSHAEHERLVEICVETVNGKAQVIAGAGSNSTAEAIRLTKHARDAGADAALIVAPYYNRPTQEGLYRHFASIAEAIDIPIVIYNIPGRSGVNITDETLARLAKIPNIAGLKDATGDLARVSALRLLAGERFEQLSGEDMTAPAFNALGGVGCISVTSNIAPKLCAEQQALTLAGDYQSALRLQDRLAPLHQAMFCETSPAPVKYAASRLGFCSPALRPPLLEASQEAQARVQKAMRQAGLL